MLFKINGVLETQLNLMVNVNDSGNVQNGDDVHKPLKAKSAVSNRKRKKSSENVALSTESQSKPKAKRKYI